MIIPVVDDNDNIIGYKERSELLPTDIYRVCGLTIINDSEQILLTKRAFTKKHDPGKLSFAAAGTVEQGETYAQSMVREAYEEL
jgi:8-oxo-dGTP pyrophosphatase MutT (NUDIX family)